MDRHTCTPTDMLRLIPTLRHTRPAHPQSHARARAHQNLQAPSLSNTETNRSAQKHKGMGTRRERSKQHTNAPLEASRVPHPGTPNPTPMHPDLHDTHPPPPRARADTGIFPFKHLARPQEVTSTAAISSARSLSKYFWCSPWKCTGTKTQFHSLGFIWSWAVLYVFWDRKRKLYALIFNFGECGITPLLLVEMKMC